jgi:hypothetical protein
VPGFSIPSPYREPLTKLARLPDAEAERLTGEIGALRQFSPVSLIEKATATALGESATPAERQFTLPLLALRGQLRHMSPDKIGDQLSQSRDLDLEDHERAQLHARAAALLATSVFSSSGVATDLQTQNPRNYQSARIVTDLRPVFEDNVTIEPKGAVIVETLQIQTWTREGVSEQIFVSMDEHDLRQLKRTVERALEKTETLRRFLAEKSLAYFELEKEEVEV